MTLLDVELRRALARRLVRFTALLALLGIVVAAIIVFFSHSDVPPGPAPTFGEDCVEVAPGEIQCFGGFQAVSDERFHLADLKGVFGGMIVPLVILAWLLGASLVGGEWRAGTMTTLLTWEPRRVRVMLAKVAAAVIVGMSFFVVFQVVLGFALLPTAIFRGTTEGFDLADTARFLLRGMLLAGVGGMIGFALGSLGRNTTMAMTAGFIYLAVLEGGLLGGFFPGIRRWLIVGNSIVLMTGGSVDITGRGQVGAGVMLLTYGLGAVAIATAVFRARDVT